MGPEGPREPRGSRGSRGWADWVPGGQGLGLEGPKGSMVRPRGSQGVKE